MRLFVCIFDDARLLPHFLRHYSRFDFSEFHIARPPHLAEYVTTASRGYPVIQYEGFDVAESVTGGGAAVSAMRREVQLPDEWIVIVDLDEFVEFSRPIRDILDDAEAEDANVVRGIMYDRFPIDGRPADFTDASDLPTAFPVRARFIKKVMGGFDKKGVLVKGLLRNKAAHHTFHGERPATEHLEVSHYKWTDPSLRRIRQAIEMTEAEGIDWSIEYKRILDHYEEHGRFAWETFGGELVGPADSD